MITVTVNEKRKSLEEFRSMQKAEALLQRKSIRWVLFAVRIIRNNFPKKVIVQ